MPQLLPAVIAYVLPTTAATAFTIGTTVVTYASIISTVLVAGGSYLAARSMMSVPDFASLENQAAGKLQMRKETTPTRRVIYGTQRVSGPIAYAGTSGDKNIALDLIILLAGHECSGGGSAGHHGVYLNDVRAIEGDGTINSPFDASNLAALMKLGLTNQTAVNIPTDEWQTGLANRQLKGITYLHVALKHDPQVFPSGIPNVSVVLDGKKVYSVTGSFDTKVFSDNPADILYDYLTDEFGCTVNEIDLDSFQDSHAISNEIVSGSLGQYQQKRYTCNMTYQTSEKPQDIITNILKSCYGKLIYTNGKFAMKVGAYSYPTVTLNEADLRDGISLTTRSPSAQSYNKVTGLFIEGSNYTSSYQSAEFVPYTSSFALTEDNGIESVQNIELLSVNNQRQARRLGAIALLDSRQDMVLSYPTKASGLVLQAGDNVYINNSRFGFVTKSFELTSVSINPDLSCDLTLKETSPEIYAWAESEQDVSTDISPNTTLPDPFIVAAIQSLTASNVPVKESDGSIFPGVELTWPNQGSGSIASIELDYKEDIESNWTTLGRLGTGTTTFTTLDVTAGLVYDFRIRQFNYFGVYSPYATASILVVGDNTIPQAPTGSAEVGTGSVVLTWTYPNPQEADYRHTKVVINNVLQGYVAGTTYTKQLSGGGPITASLQDFDTSGNGSATSSLIYARVAALSIVASGSVGPSGSKGDYYLDVYKRDPFLPATPTSLTAPPPGWTKTIPDDTGDALWVSTAQIQGSDDTTVIGSWSAPKKLSGRTSYYQTNAPAGSATGSLSDGDLWFDTDDSFKVYRWASSSFTWLSVQDANIPTIQTSVTASFATSSVYSASLASTITANSASFTTTIVAQSNRITADSSSLAASITTTNGAVTTNSSSFAASITTLTATVNTNSSSLASSITTTNGVVTNNSSSFALSINSLTSTVNTNSSSFASSLTNTNNTATTNSSSFAISINNLTSTVNNNSSSLASSLTTTNNTVATNSSSAATSITNLTSTVTNNSSSFASSLTTTNNTVSTNSSSAATSITTLSSTVNTNSSSAAASITQTASTVAQLSGSVAAEYVLNVTAGNRVAGFKVGVGTANPSTSSNFTIQADKLEFVNTSGTGPTIPFQIDGGVVYMDGAIIRNLQAGNISAGVINAAIRMTAGEITGSGYQVVGVVGMRSDSNDGTLTITGGTNNGDSNGAQIDLLGTSAPSNAGVLNLVAGNVGNGGTTQGFIQFYTGGTQRGFIYNSGVMNLKRGITFGAGEDNLTRLGISDEFAGNVGECMVFTGGNGAVNDNAFRWVNYGNSLQLMSLSTTGSLTLAAAANATAFNTISTQRLKENIKPLTGSLHIVEQLQGVSFDWKNKSKENDIGVIAEEVDKLLPMIVWKNNDGQVQGVDYSRITPVLIEAIKEISVRLTKAEQTIAKLKKNK